MVLDDLIRQHYFYAELRFAPSYHIQHGMTRRKMRQKMKKIVEAVLRAMNEKRPQIRTKLILAIPREIAYPKNFIHTPAGKYLGPSAEDIADVALYFQNEGVAALDLACSEHDGPEAYLNAYQKTFGEKLKRTVHAGECGDNMEENIRFALYEMYADGLGHALPLPNMAPEMKFVLDNNIRIERNPISNWCMTVGDGKMDKIWELFHNKIWVTVNSDDPGVFGPQCSLANNLFVVANQLVLAGQFKTPIEAVQHMTRNVILSAYLSNEEKLEMMEWYDKKVG